MKKNNLFYILILILFILFLPLATYNFKFEINKKTLHSDKEHYEKINNVCFKEKNTSACLVYAKEDLKILLNEHKNNLKIINNTSGTFNPYKLFKKSYKKTENMQNIEPEILLKTMIIKQQLFKTSEKEPEGVIFGQEMEYYIINNFSKKNRALYIKLLQTQDSELEKISKKRHLKQNKRSLTDIIGR